MTLSAKKMFAPGILLALALLSFGCADNSEEIAQANAAAEEAARADSIAVFVADSIEAAAAAAAAEEAAREAAAAAEAPEEMPRHESLEVEYGVYTVQIGSYDSRELAQPFLTKLEGEGLEPYLIDELITVNGAERQVFRLRFGKYASKDEAHNRGSEVALRYELDYWVDNYKF